MLSAGNVLSARTGKTLGKDGKFIFGGQSRKPAVSPLRVRHEIGDLWHGGQCAGAGVRRLTGYSAWTMDVTRYVS
jgi:hypothetical protein